MLSLISYFLFMLLPGIWLLKLAAVEIIIMVAAVRKYVWCGSRKKRNIVELLGAYVLLWCGLLAQSYCSGMTFDLYLYGGDWKSGIVIIIVSLLFLVMSHRLLGKHAIFNRNYLVYKAAWWMLAMRIILGIPYSMGVIPMPISLPFAGEIGFYMDTIAFGLLIWSAIEAKYIDKSVYVDKKISDLFAGTEVKIIHQDKEEFEEKEEFGEEEILWAQDEVVQVCSTNTDTTMRCFAQKDKKYNVLVLKLLVGNEKTILIVEKAGDTDLWHDFENAFVRKKILYKYMEYRKPDSMERLRELVSIGNEKNIQLACFCTEEDICHRSIVAGVLSNMGANMECKETIAKFSQMVKIENAEW